MSRTTSTTTSTTNDVSTLRGFLAQYDQEISTLIDAQGWCGEAMSYAYPSSTLPRPSDRPQVLSIPDEWLNDTGKAEVAKQHAASFLLVRQEVIAVAERVYRRGYLTREQVNDVFSRLGIPEVTATQHHNGAIALSLMFTSPARIGTTDRLAMQEAVKAAVAAVFDGKAMLTDDGTGYVEVTSDRYPTDSAQWPTL